MFVRLTMPLFCLLGASFSWAQAGPGASEAVNAGRKAFVQACGFCHGDDASGSRAPDLIRSPVTGHDKEGNLISAIVRNGRSEKGMPSFSAGALSDDKLAQIVLFLHARHDAARRSSKVATDYPVEKLLTGNATAGQSYFNGAGGCASCHSPAGDLKGIATRLQPLALQQQFLYPPKKQLRTATITPAGGSPRSGKLVHLDDFSVAIEDNDGWYHSFDRTQVALEVKDPLQKHRELLYRYTDADIHNLFAYLQTLK